jgi:serine phosphatase RsbU (regulator of sigma subunit)
MPRRYTAIQYAVFDPLSHELQIASAGMPGPFHLSASGCRNLKLCGIPPGLFAAANHETLTLRLLAGDSVLFCTDGISDAFSRKEEQFGIETAARDLRRPTVRLALRAARTGLRRCREFFPRAGTARRYGCGTLSFLKVSDASACAHKSM